MPLSVSARGKISALFALSTYVEVSVFVSPFERKHFVSFREKDRMFLLPYSRKKKLLIFIHGIKRSVLFSAHRQFIWRKQVPWSCSSPTKTIAKLTLLKETFTGLHDTTETNRDSTSVTTAVTYLTCLLLLYWDTGEPNNRQGPIFKIKCSDCQASYIGETAFNDWLWKAASLT